LFSQPPGGRPQVAMLACIGYIVPEYFRWPGDLAPAVLERWEMQALLAVDAVAGFIPIDCGKSY